MKNRLTTWVMDHFAKDPIEPSQGFNVHTYSDQEKALATQQLQEAGYLVSLSNQNNHLEVTRSVQMTNS